MLTIKKTSAFLKILLLHLAVSSSTGLVFSFRYGDLDSIPRLLAYFDTDIFPYPDNVARGSHFYQAAIVGHSVKGSGNRHPPSPKFRLDVKWQLNIGAINVRHFFYFCFKFIRLTHKYLLKKSEQALYFGRYYPAIVVFIRFCGRTKGYARKPWLRALKNCLPFRIIVDLNS